uniref:Uncharacterized protein n=1 Tax=Panagrolaimus sp. ES5 TaxID=591445 RepID=A0AC34GCU2_9BILA
MHFQASQRLLNPNFSETKNYFAAELLYWVFENSKLIYSLLGLFIGTTIFALTNCARFSRRNNIDPAEAEQLKTEIYGGTTEKEGNKLGSERIQKVEKSQTEGVAKSEENDLKSAKETTVKDGKKLDLSSVRDSIKVAKINQQRNSPNREAPVKAAKMIYTKSGSQADKSTFDSTCEGSIKFVSAESLTDEIVVPVGKTSRAPVPQSSLTSLNNLKTLGESRSEVAVKFGEERISTKRTKP